MRRHRWFGFALAAVLFAGGCGGDEEGSSGTRPGRSGGILGGAGGGANAGAGGNGVLGANATPENWPGFEPQALNRRWVRKETKLVDAKDAAKVVPKSWRVSPDGLRWAYARLDGTNAEWIVDGKSRAEFSTKGQYSYSSYQPALTFTFSGDSKHFLCAGSDTLKPGTAFVIDDKTTRTGDWSLLPTSVLLNHDGSQFALIGQNLYVNGEKFGTTTGPVIAAKTIATLQKTPEGKISHNGKEYPGHPVMQDLTLSADGKGFAYVATQDNQQFVVHNGLPQKRFDKVLGRIYSATSLALSADGQHYAVAGTDGSKTYVLHDNVRYEIPSCSTVNVILSPDGKRWAAHLTQQYSGQFAAYVDGKAVESHLSNGSVAFSHDSRQYMCAAFHIDKVEKPPAGGQAPPKTLQYEYRVRPAINVSGQILRMDWLQPAIVNDYGQKVVGGGAVVGRLGDPHFSPDGRFLACWATEKAGGPKTITVNGRKLGNDFDRFHDGIPMAFSVDSHYLGYVIRRNALWCVVLNGKEFPGYDAIGIDGSRVGFTSKGSFTYIARRRDGSVYWVEEFPR